MSNVVEKGGHAPPPDVPEDPGADMLPLADQGRVDEYQLDSLHAEEALQRGVEAAESGDEPKAVQEYLRAAKIAETAREWYVAAVALQRVGEFLERPAPPPYDLERALRTYRRAVAAYERCGLFDEARQLGYRVQYLKLRRGRELRLSPWTRVELLGYWLVAGFGYRPLRVVMSAAVIVLVYALLYLAVGGVRVAGTGDAAGFLDSLYFSGITFSTVGYGDLVPAPHARLLALTEGALGAILIGFFVVVLNHRLRH